NAREDIRAFVNLFWKFWRRLTRRFRKARGSVYLRSNAGRSYAGVFRPAFPRSPLPYLLFRLPDNGHLRRRLPFRLFLLEPLRPELLLLTFKLLVLLVVLSVRIYIDIKYCHIWRDFVEFFDAKRLVSRGFFFY